MWAMIVPATLAIVVGTILSMTPDDPAELYTECRGYIENESGDKIKDFDATIGRLRAFP